jgi:hypothetical protein
MSNKSKYGKKYNFIEECPLDFMYYGYEKDNLSASYYNVFGDTIHTKNAYNYNYSVQSILTSATSVSCVSATLYNARTYYDPSKSKSSQISQWS